MTRGTQNLFGTSAAFVAAADSAFNDDGILRLWLGLDTSVTGRSVARWESVEGSAVFRPLLTINYIPEPSTFLMVLLPLGALLARRSANRRSAR